MKEMNLLKEMEKLVGELVKSYQTDLNYDKETMFKNEPTEYYWIARKCGTELISIEDLKYTQTGSYTTALYFRNEPNVFKIKVTKCGRKNVYGFIERANIQEFHNAIDSSKDMDELTKLRYILKFIKCQKDKFENMSEEEKKNYARGNIAGDFYYYGSKGYEYTNENLLTSFRTYTSYEELIADLNLYIKRLETAA